MNKETITAKELIEHLQKVPKNTKIGKSKKKGRKEQRQEVVD